MTAPSGTLNKEPRLVWTGGQFSVVRALVGCLIGIRYILLLPIANAPIFATDEQDLSTAQEFLDGAKWIGPAPLGYLPLALGLLLAIALALGYRTRAVSFSLVLLFLAEVTEGLSPHGIAVPTLAVLAIYCALQPPEPFGSLSARGRLDPGGAWSERRFLRPTLWVWFQLGALFTATTFLRGFDSMDGTDPLWVVGPESEGSYWLRSWTSHVPAVIQSCGALAYVGIVVVAAILSLFARTRFAAWCLFFGLHVALLGVLTIPMRCFAGMLVLLAMFDPNWLAPKRIGSPVRVFYDGECGLCHRMVRLILAEDQSADGFRFAPLQSPAFESRVDAKQRAELPDSVAVLTTDGELAVRTTAVIQILDGLGGLWRVAAFALRVPPRALVDLGYDAVASVRKKLFLKPEGACPMIPPKLGERFDF